MMKRFCFFTLLLLLTAFTSCTYDAESVEVRPETLIMAIGNTYQMHAKVKPDKASQHVEWSSTDASVATVSDLGMITAVRPGKCEIVAYAGDVKAACQLTVK